MGSPPTSPRAGRPVPVGRPRRARAAGRGRGRVLGVLGLSAALIVVAVAAGALAGLLATARLGGDGDLSGGYLGDKVVSWIDTSTALVESVAGVEPPQCLDVDSGVRRRLPVEDVLMHLGGAGWAVGADKNGALLAVDLSRRAACGPAVSRVAAARCGAKSPDGRLVAARELADGAPTDAWWVLSTDGARVARLTPDGAGSAGGEPAWTEDSQAVAVPLEPGGAREATLVVAWAPDWRPIEVRVAGYEGGTIAFDPTGANLVFAKPGRDGEGELKRVGRGTGMEDLAVRIAGLGGLMGRAADGRLAVYVTRAAPEDLEGGPGPATGAVLLVREPPTEGARPGEAAWPLGGPEDVIRLPRDVESAVLDPSGLRALVVCADGESTRRLYVVDLAAGTVRPVPLGGGSRSGMGSPGQGVRPDAGPAKGGGA